MNATVAAEVKVSRGRGRPRDVRVDAAVADAIAEVLAEVGYDALTIEEVASRAGVAKTTLYRRWRTKAHMVADGLDLPSHAKARLSDTGSLHSDLLLYMQAASDALAEPFGQAVIGLVFAARREPELAEALRQKLIASRRAEINELLNRAEFRGELKPGLDRQLLLDLVIGPLWYRELVWGESRQPGQLAALLDMLLAGCTTTRGVELPEPTPGRRSIFDRESSAVHARSW